MLRMCRWMLLLLALLGSVRVIVYAIYASVQVPLPVPTWHYESMFVALAWRIQHGHALYPAWEDYPHVFNFFAPLYFWIVGWTGALFGLDIPGLFTAGRLITLASSLLPSLGVAMQVRHQIGRMGAVVAGSLTIGSAAMTGYSVMVRPDMFALCLAFVGFLLAVRQPLWCVVSGAMLLSLAVFAKQTYAMYAVAAVISLLGMSRVRDAGILSVVGVALAIAVVSVAAAKEPHFLECLFSEGQFPLSWTSFGGACKRLFRLTPELVVCPIVGLAYWSTRTSRDIPLAVLAACLLVGSFASSAKFGADLNYFLGLQVFQGFVLVTLWQRTLVRHGTLLHLHTAAILVVLISFVAGSWSVLISTIAAVRQADFKTTPAGRVYFNQLRQLQRVALRRGAEIFTDHDMLAVYQCANAEFLDAQDFRVLVQQGRINPRRIVERLSRGEYELLILSADIDSPDYASYYLRLPEEVAAAARSSYARIRVWGGHFLYAPRPVR